MSKRLRLETLSFCVIDLAHGSRKHSGLSTVFQILDNLVFLSFLGVFFYFIRLYGNDLSNIRRQVLNGLSFGIVALLVTATPVSMGDGATVDTRAGPILLAGIFAGPFGALLAASIGAIGRGLVGGSFAPSGMVVYFVYAFFGLALIRFRVVVPEMASTWRSLVLLTLASWLGASAMFFLIQPLDRAIVWLQQDLPYIFLANALSVFGVGIIIGFAAHLVRQTCDAVKLGETLNLAKHAGKIGVWDFNVSTGDLTWDSRSKELHGVDQLGFSSSYEAWSQTVHPDDLSSVQVAFAKSLAAQVPFSVEYRVVLSDGSINTIRGNAVVLRDGSGKPLRVVGTNLDLSELRETEKKLSAAQSLAEQSQKFETIGQLTGGVAHDFNNLLAVVMGNQELLKFELEQSPIDIVEVKALIDASIEASKRGAELTQNMLAYARQAHLRPVPTDLNQVIRETENWLRRTIESSVQIETVLQAGLWPALVDRASLQSALVNLLVNARDALEGAGKVTVETCNIRIDEEYIRSTGEDISVGRYVMLAVSDNGPGIPRDQIDRIFDPFFTTKITGKGSGLGLSMVQGFVKQSQGAIRVYSEIGVGTSFKLYFPVSTGDAEEGVPHQVSLTHSEDRRVRRERILLVEDSEQVISVLRKILVNAQYDVVVAMNGDDAVCIFQDDQKFDLVVTDIVMPGLLQGPALAKEIRQLSPKMPFVFISGYASEATVHGNGLRPEDIRLMKPVSRATLLQSIENALGDVEKSGGD